MIVSSPLLFKEGARGGQHTMKNHGQHFFNRHAQKLRRQHLRNNATPAERKLWTHLQNNSLLGYKFRRQHGIGPYIADFYCPEAKLVVELDGAVNCTEEAAGYDKERDLFMFRHGISTIRFRNSEVWNNMDNLLQTIAQFLNCRR